LYVDPRDIALRDRDEFYVEKILAHRGDVGRLKTLVFHDKWRGFDESFKSWEPWKNLQKTEILHRYLILLPRTCSGVDRMWRLMK
jgi:hypothetical protein